MERIEYRNVMDKAGWDRGPWDDEPDKVQFEDKATGLPCLIVRGPVGALCGYVGVPTGHPLHGVSYGGCRFGDKCPSNGNGDWCDHRPEHFLNVHGGITFADGCAKTSRAKWEKWRKTFVRLREDAKRFPFGDSAKHLREWGDAEHSYEVYVERSAASLVCHKPSDGEPDDIWWFGFDCCHAFDLAPQMTAYRKLHASFETARDDTYRDIAYVTAEIESLAKQLAALKHPQENSQATP